MTYKLTPKDLTQIRAGLRSAFFRSDLRKEVIANSVRKHSNPSRPKVKVWCECYVCHKLEAKSYMVVDHIVPYTRPDLPFAEMTPHEWVYRLWCDISNLGAICPACHLVKTNQEKAHKKELRRLAKLKA